MTGVLAVRTALYQRLAGDATFLALLNGDADRILHGFVPDLPQLWPDTIKGPFWLFRELGGGTIYPTSSVLDPGQNHAGEIPVLAFATAKVESIADSDQYSGFGSLEELCERAQALLHQYSVEVGGRTVKFRLSRPYSDTFSFEGSRYDGQGFSLESAFSSYHGA